MGLSWIEILYNLFQIPRRVFKFIGFSPFCSPQVHVITAVTDSDDRKMTEQVLAQLNITEPRSQELLSKEFIDSDTYWGISFQTLLSQLFTNFPASLEVGIIQVDLTTLSLVLLSAFVAILSSSFVLFISNLRSINRFQNYQTDYDNLFRKNLESDKPAFYSVSLPLSKSSDEPGEAVIRPSHPRRSINAQSVEFDKNTKKSNNDSRCMNSGDGILLHLPVQESTVCLDAESLAMETLLRVAGLPYDIRYQHNSAPHVLIGGVFVNGFCNILKLIAAKYPVEYTRVAIPVGRKIQAHLIQLHLENDLERAIRELQSCHRNNYWNQQYPDDHILRGQHRNPFSSNTILAQVSESLEILSSLLGTHTYFIDNHITEVDVSIFAVLTQLMYGFPENSSDLLMEHPNLWNFCMIILEEIWPDWECRRFSRVETLRSNDADKESLADCVGTGKNFSESSSNKFPNVPCRTSRTRTKIRKFSTIPFVCPPDIESLECIPITKIVETSHNSRGDNMDTLSSRELNNSVEVLHQVADKFFKYDGDQSVREVINRECDDETRAGENESFRCTKHQVVLGAAVVRLLNSSISSNIEL